MTPSARSSERCDVMGNLEDLVQKEVDAFVEKVKNLVTDHVEHANADPSPQTIEEAYPSSVVVSDGEKTVPDLSSDDRQVVVEKVVEESPTPPVDDKVPGEPDKSALPTEAQAPAVEVLPVTEPVSEPTPAPFPDPTPVPGDQAAS
jgi:hypothetical protein